MINASQGAAFVMQGNAIEIVRQDQPICRVPLADLVELGASLASRIRCAMNHAVLYVTPSMRSNCFALMPFLDEQSR